MLTAFSEKRKHCYAWDTEKSEAPFFCKACLQEVILKKGMVRAHHFAHKPPISCQYGSGESELHHKVKKSIFESLKSNQNCSYCELEQKIPDIIPDIFAIINGVNVDIEIQRSNITVNDIRNKIISRTKQNLSSIWIIPSILQLKIFKDDNKKVANIPEWIKYLHTIYFGKIYVYSGQGSLVLPIHLSQFKRYIPENEFYNQEGEYIYAGGYSKPLKNRRIINPAPQGLIDIGSNFRSKFRDPFKAKVPQCLIWHDSLEQWWR